MDFGISKILSEGLDEIKTATVTKMGVMTPAYASPEQLQKESVTTATDIYSLGVILYELLSGHRPFQEKENDFKEIISAVLESEPPLPSAIIETASKRFDEFTGSEPKFEKDETGDKTEILEDRTVQNLTPRTVPNKTPIKPQSLKGDLDNIILKALKKEPERRYSSAENFAEDIKRHQNGLPVTARPDTFSYRASKFIKRNSYAVGAAAVMMFLLIGGLIATLWQARIAQAERIKAEKRFDDVRSLANSFLFKITPEIENLPGSLKARQLLVEEALEYLNKLSADAGENFELQREIADAYKKVGDLQGNPNQPNIGDTEGAFKSYEKSLEIRQKLFDKNPQNTQARVDLARTMAAIGELQVGSGSSEKAKPLFDKVLKLYEQSVKENPKDFSVRRDFAKSVRIRGLIFFLDGNMDKTIEYYSRATDMYEKLLKENPDEYEIEAFLYETYSQIGDTYGWKEDFKNSEKNLRIAVEGLESLNKKYPDNQKIQRALYLALFRFADYYSYLEKYQKAIEMFTESLELAQDLEEKNPKNKRAKKDVAGIAHKLGESYTGLGRKQDALKYLNLSLQTNEKLKKEDPTNVDNIYNVASSQQGIGNMHLSSGEYDKALKAFGIAVADYKSIIKIDPDDEFTKRGLYSTHEAIANTYIKLADGKGNRAESISKAIENLQIARDGLEKMLSEKKLSDLDIKQLEVIKTELDKLTKIKQKL